MSNQENAWSLNLVTAEALWLPVVSEDPPASFPKRKAKLTYEDPRTGKRIEWNPMKNSEQAFKLILPFSLRLAYWTNTTKDRFVSAHQEWNSGNSEWDWKYVLIDPREPDAALRKAICQAVAYIHRNPRSFFNGGQRPPYSGV